MPLLQRRPPPPWFARAVDFLVRRGRGILGAGAAARQSLLALALNSVASLLAGAVLGATTDTFARLPGLLVLVPAAIGLRGNIFSTLGNRLSTAIHTGALELNLGRGSVLRQNTEASLVLTLGLSAVLAVLAWLLALALDVDDLTSPLVLIGISVGGGILASMLVLGATLALTRGAVRYGWDLDNVVAPVVSTVSDGVTLPALWIAAQATRVDVLAEAMGALGAAAAIGAFAYGLTAKAPLLRRITRESWPILAAAGLLSTLAGMALEGRLETWQVLPALLVLQPAFVSSAGAMGGILSSRTASKLHLGQVPASAIPGSEVRADAALIAGLALPIYLLNGAGAHFVARLLGQNSPGLEAMVLVALIGGLVAVLWAVAVAYYGTVAATSFGVDPDTYGIPIVTSSVDFAGVIALIATVSLLQLV